MAVTTTVTTIYDTEQPGMGKLKTPTAQYGQGPADPIIPGSVEALNNENGFTHPDLHRTIDPADPQLLSDKERDLSRPGEIEPRSYSVGIYGTDSHRTTHKIVHTEKEFISETGQAAKSPTWNLHASVEDEFIPGGDQARWNVFPPEVNPLSRGTPDEIP